MKKLVMFTLISVAFVFVGCAKPVGIFYTNTTDIGSPTRVATTTVGSKKGTATSRSILGLVATGSSGIAAAAKNGGIKKIETVDTKVKNILGIYISCTTIVTGE